MQNRRYYTNMNYAFRVFAFNPRKVNRKDAPKTWEELLQPKWKGEILFDESSLEEVMALLGAWGKDKNRELSDQAEPAAALDPRRPRYRRPR